MRVEHDDVGARLGVDRQLRPPRGDEPGVARQPLDFGEALGLPGRQDRERAGQRRLDPRERAQDTPPPRLASCCRRRRRSGWATGGRTAGRARAASRATSAVGSSSESNFRLPVTVTRAGSAPSVDQPARRLLALHAEAIDVGEHAAEKRPHEAVARIRPRRDAAVDHDGLHAARAADAQQVRPDLGLHHDEQPRLHRCPACGGR